MFAGQSVPETSLASRASLPRQAPRPRRTLELVELQTEYFGHPAHAVFPRQFTRRCPDGRHRDRHFGFGYCHGGLLPKTGDKTDANNSNQAQSRSPLPIAHDSSKRQKGPWNDCALN
jgi:hypothetical protein